MMRLLFLCLLLLLPAATALSEEPEGSAFDDSDDEDGIQKESGPNVRSGVEKTTGEDNSSDQMTLIVVVVAVTVLALSVAVIVAIILVKRHMRLQQQAVYSVPTEQNQKEAI